MLLAGDEVGRTQNGNNNAYCQDNELNWLDWYWDDNRWRLLNFTKKVIALRREHPLFRRRDFFHGIVVGDGTRKDVEWIKPDGQEMTTEEWEKDFARCLGMWLNGDELPETDDRGHTLHDDSFLVLFNAHHDRIDFVLPDAGPGVAFWPEIDTSCDTGIPRSELFKSNATYPLQGRSLVVLRQLAQPS
jgi:glycogen operon protein